MSQWVRSHLTYANVMATIAVFLVLGGMSYAATGGNFILGKSNTAGAPTQLSSPTTNSAGALKVSNTSTGTPGRGITAAGGASGYGLWASGGNRSTGTAAVHGQSGAGNAVEGFSTADLASAVFGQDNKANSYGVAGHSANGIAVVGDSSNGWAMQALGNTTQTRDRNGFVKAMARINPTQAPAVRQCFNSQLPPSQGPTTVPCGITYNRVGPGKYLLTFNFEVDDRFFSVTDRGSAVAITAAIPNGTNAVKVTTYFPSTRTFEDDSFYIIVY